MMQKVAGRLLVQGAASPSSDWKTPNQPSSKWLSFFNHRRIRLEKKTDRLRFSFAVPKTWSDSNPRCPYGY